jgi:DNA-binding response OmpR family regulator
MPKTEEPIRVLILEDDPMISMSLEAIVEDVAPAVVTIRASLAAAENIVEQQFDLALLDIELTNGKTYEIARTLDEKQVPVAFVSANPKDQMPDEFRRFTLIAKPFTAAQIEQAILAATKGKRS